jgi:hypothetical protein
VFADRTAACRDLVAADLPGDLDEHRRVDPAAGVVRHEHAAGQLGELAGHADEDHVAQPVLDRLAQRAPVKSPTSTKQTSGRSGSIRIAAFSVAPPVASTSVGSPCAAITDTACTTDARHDSVENGRTTPVVPGC